MNSWSSRAFDRRSLHGYFSFVFPYCFVSPKNMYCKLASCLVFCVIAISAIQAQTEVRSEAARRHYELGQGYERKGDWSAAEKEWRQTLAVDPNDGKAWTNLGVVLNKQNKTEEAIRAWKRATEVDSSLAGAYFNLGLVFVRSQSYREAIVPLQRALILEPQNDGARRALALALVGTEQFREAS